MEINKHIIEAYDEDNFARILYLDGQRREILRTLASNPDFLNDDENLKLIKETAEENQEMVANIADRMTALTKKTNGKIRMLRSYHVNR
jgi:negative regulator of sigma E activity